MTDGFRADRIYAELWSGIPAQYQQTHLSDHERRSVKFDPKNSSLKLEFQWSSSRIAADMWLNIWNVQDQPDRNE